MTSQPEKQLASAEHDKRDQTYRRWRIASIITYAVFVVALFPWTFQPHTDVLDTIFWTAFTVSLAVGFITEIMKDRVRRAEQTTTPAETV